MGKSRSVELIPRFFPASQSQRGMNSALLSISLNRTRWKGDLDTDGNGKEEYRVHADRQALPAEAGVPGAPCLEDRGNAFFQDFDFRNDA
jgi:hypothetical protein